MNNKNSDFVIKEINKNKNLKENQFDKETPRKMTLHILSDKEKDCISLVEFLTKEKFPNSKELLEKNIKNKVNLYSYMNYKIYKNASYLMKKMVIKCRLAQDKDKNVIFSEVIIIIDNESIYDQIKEIKKEIEDDDNNLMINEYNLPFILIISPRSLYLKGFSKTKTFQYEIYLEDILNFNVEFKKEKKDEIMKFYRKINVLFSYYNELGNEFSFTNSEGKNIHIKIENSNFPINMNILLLGESGAGKSTISNLILGEKKSLEGGNGVSTTSKNIIVYKKEDVPIKIYDVKGIDGKESIDNYINILTELNGNIKISNDSLNTILFCMKYKTGTVLYDMLRKIFEKLIDYNIPILFVITHTPYDIRKISTDKKTEKTRKNNRDIIITTIKKFFKDAFINKKKGEEESEKFINEFVKIYFVNLVQGNNEYPVPIFGIDKVLSFFNELIPKENWEGLKESCLKQNVEKCIKYCQSNLFLKNYSQFEIIKERNRVKALNYLNELRTGAFLTGLLPLADLGMEYLYRHLFTEKLKLLYGFGYDEAELIIQRNSKTKLNMNSFDSEEKIPILSSQRINNVEIKTDINNNNKMEQKIENQIDKEVNNKLRNTISVLRVGASFGIKFAFSIPASVFFGWLSQNNIDNDCHKILEIFEKAYTPLRFKTLNSYVVSFMKAIQYLDGRGKEIVLEANKDEENEIE